MRQPRRSRPSAFVILFNIPQSWQRHRVCSASARRRLVCQGHLCCPCQSANNALSNRCRTLQGSLHSYSSKACSRQLTTPVPGWKRSRKSKRQTPRPYAARNSSIQGIPPLPPTSKCDLSNDNYHYRSTNPCSLSASTSSQTSTSAFASPAVVTHLRSTPSDKPSRSQSWPTTRNTWTSMRRTS